MTVITSVLILFVTMGSGIVLARVLGPTERGILTAAMLFGPLITSIGGLGIADALVYRSGQSGGVRSPALVTALYIGGAQSLVLVLVGFAIVPALLRGHGSLTSHLAVAYLAYIPLFFLNQYPLSVLQGRLRLMEFNLVRASVPVVYTTTLLLLWLFGGLSLEAAIAAALGSAVVASVLAIIGSARLSTWAPSFSVARELLGYGIRAHAGNLATILVAQLDLLMLTAMVPARSLGYYAVATSAALAGSLVPTAASLVLFPTFANRSKEAIPRALARFLLWGLGGSLILMPVLVLVVPWAVVPVYGNAFHDAAAISVILVPGYLLRGCSQMLVAILRGTGTPMRASAGQIAGLVALAALLPVGIAAQGTEGAALAVTVAAAVTCAWLLTTALRRDRMPLQFTLSIWRSDFVRLKQSIRWRGPLVRP